MGKMKTTQLTLAMTVVAALAGCASVRSMQLQESPPKAGVQGGMVYYLPTQLLELTLNVDDKGAKLSLSASKPMADPRQSYVAQFRRNHIGSGKLAVKANTDGLLAGELSGSTTGNLGEALKALAGSTAVFHALNLTDKDKCKDAGVYKWVFDVRPDPAVEDALKVCGLSVEVLMPSGEQYPDSTTARNWKGLGSKPVSGAGFFYRQRMPVVVKVTHTVDNQRRDYVFYESIAGAHSPIEFMPVPRVVFANNQWKISFENGVPTVYDIDAGGDVIGLFKLPAEVVSAYSTAVGEGFKRRKGLLTDEAAYLEQVNKLAAQQAKYEICRSAVQSDDKDKIKTACQ